MGRLPTMPPIGFSCAWKGSCCQRRGPAASTATTTDTLVPKTQTTSPTTPRLSPFFTEVVCTLGTTPPQTVISPPPNGGNGVIRTTTRRRHADSQPLMLQNPHRHRYGGHRRGRRARAPRPDPAPRQPGTRTREPGAAPQGRQGLHTASISSTGQPRQDTHRAVRQDDPDADDHPPQAPLRGRQVLRGEELIHPVTTGRLRSRIRGRCYATTLAQSSLCPRGSVNR